MQSYTSEDKKCNRHVSAALRIVYCEAVVTSVACPGTGHRKMHHEHLQ